MKYLIELNEENHWVAKELDEHGNLIAEEKALTPSFAVQKLVDRNKPNAIHNTVRYHVNNFIDTLEPMDESKMNISTEVFMHVTPEGAQRVKGDEYMSLVCRKHNTIPEGAVLQDTMIYPAKQVFESFKDIEARVKEEEQE